MRLGRDPLLTAARLLARGRSSADPAEALLARERALDVLSARDLGLADLEAWEGETAIARGVSGGDRGGWRTALAGALSRGRGCLAKWEGGDLRFVGPGAGACASLFLLAAAEAQVRAASTVPAVEVVRRPAVFDLVSDLGLLGALLGPPPSGDLARARAAASHAHHFLIGFARAVASRAPVRGPAPAPPPPGAPNPDFDSAVERARALAEEVGVGRAARVMEEAEALGEALGRSIRLVEVRSLPPRRGAAWRGLPWVRRPEWLARWRTA